MIPLDRPPAPPSLGTPEIRQYVADCGVYAAACAAAADPSKVTRPDKPGIYRNSDVLKAFETHFFSKCYLTEQWHGSAYEMDVDHFRPAAEFPELACDWENLFPAAHKANMLRPRKWPAGGLLNPCQDDIENRLEATIGPDGQTPHFRAAEPLDSAASNTANLLNLLHTGRAGDAHSFENTRHLRVTIAEQHGRILRAIMEWLHAEKEGAAQRRANARRRLEDLLSRKAPFTMLMRSIEAVILYVPPEFLD